MSATIRCDSCGRGMLTDEVAYTIVVGTATLHACALTDPMGPWCARNLVRVDELAQRILAGLSAQIEIDIRRARDRARLRALLDERADDERGAA